MIRNWRKDKKDWGGNMGEEKINNTTAPKTNSCIKSFCAYAGLENDRFHNAWMRKTYSLLLRLLITLSLGDLMLEEEKVMAITKHKSVLQMRKDYGVYSQ
jgi:hypothetical protein